MCPMPRWRRRSAAMSWCSATKTFMNSGPRRRQERAVPRSSADSGRILRARNSGGLRGGSVESQAPIQPCSTHRSAARERVTRRHPCQTRRPFGSAWPSLSRASATGRTTRKSLCVAGSVRWNLARPRSSRSEGVTLWHPYQAEVPRGTSREPSLTRERRDVHFTLHNDNSDCHAFPAWSGARPAYVARAALARRRVRPSWMVDVPRNSGVSADRVPRPVLSERWWHD